MRGPTTVGERIPSPPPFPRRGTDPTGGVRRPGSATLLVPPLCLHSNPRSWGEGRTWGGTRDRVLAGTLCFGVSRSPASVSLRPSLEGWCSGS